MIFKKLTTLALMLVATVLISLGFFSKKFTSPPKVMLTFSKVDTYDKLWKRADSCESKGLTESALKVVDVIYNKAKTENRPLKDGDVKVACQVACPTSAIVFGDLNDENSAVAKNFKSEPRAYALLEEWNAKPVVRYLSKIKNNDKVTPKAEKHAGVTPNQSQVSEGGQV